MALPQGLAHFPNVSQVIDASMSFTHGISPSVAMLTIAPQVSPVAEGGTLSFTFAGASVSFPDCKIDDGLLRWDSEGQKWQLQILDRRWKWAWGSISGNYNVRQEDGTILDGTEKTPQELAAMCLDKIDEQGYDVGDMPNDPRPSVEWEITVPMEALAGLCDDVGCRVVLQLNNRVKICQVGQGNALPGGSLMEDELSVDPPEKPDKLGVVCGPGRYQCDFTLEAVGEDNDADHTIKPIAELAYKPSEGWGIPPQHSNITDPVDNELAKGSVFRMYRMVMPATVQGYQDDNGKDQVADVRHLIIEDEQVDYWRDDDGVKTNKSAEILGVWYPGTDGLNNTVADTLYRREGTSERGCCFSLDKGRGIVKLSAPLFGNAGSTLTPPRLIVAAAVLKLRCAVSVRNKDTLSLRRHVLERATGGNFGTPTRYVRHDELTLNYIDGVWQNSNTILTACTDFLDGLEKEYELANPQTRKYAGLVAIDLDGAVQHVTWSVGTQGATTTASRNTEQFNRVIPHKHRRALEKLRELVRAGDRITALAGLRSLRRELGVREK